MLGGQHHDIYTPKRTAAMDWKWRWIGTKESSKEAPKIQDVVADLRGESSNQFDYVFAELQDWEEMLESLPEVTVD